MTNLAPDKSRSDKVEVFLEIGKKRTFAGAIEWPRGGVIWSARNYVRRVAWHVLDHAWEIEDKVI